MCPDMCGCSENQVASRSYKERPNAVNFHDKVPLPPTGFPALSSRRTSPFPPSAILPEGSAT